MSERCPRCGCDKQLDVSEFLDGRDWGVLYYCGTIYWPSRDEVTTEGVACRQLVRAQEQLQQALAREAELRRVVERVEWVEPPDAHPDLGRWCPMCRSWEAYGHELRCPYYGGLVNGILSSAQANPYAAVVEAARQDYSSARTACEYRRVKGDCEAWTRRGRTCPDCPLEWFDALPEALGNLGREETAR